MSRAAARKGSPVACVLLAAGGSQRLGQPKQLVRHRVRPLLLHAVEAAHLALPGSPLIVVLGAHALRLRLLLRRADCGAIAVRNPRWAEGLAGSLQTGLAAAPRGTRAILVLLSDQPQVGARALLRLVRAWRGRPGLPAAAAYLDRAGVPAILPRRSWPALRALRGDSGARALLRDTAALTLVGMPEAALDIDTPADVAKLKALSSRS
jgi:molybdenum cofactor cytidylyltransferase